MARIRDLNRARRVYPFNRRRKVSPDRPLPVRTIDSATAWTSGIGLDDYLIAVTSIAGGTLTLPESALTTVGETFVVKDQGGNAATNNITIAAATGDTIDNAATHVMSINYNTAVVIWTGVTWAVV